MDVPTPSTSQTETAVSKMNLDDILSVVVSTDPLNDNASTYHRLTKPCRLREDRRRQGRKAHGGT